MNDQFKKLLKKSIKNSLSNYIHSLYVSDLDHLNKVKEFSKSKDWIIDFYVNGHEELWLTLGVKDSIEAQKLSEMVINDVVIEIGHYLKMLESFSLEYKETSVLIADAIPVLFKTKNDFWSGVQLGQDRNAELYVHTTQSIQEVAIKTSYNTYAIFKTSNVGLVIDNYKRLTKDKNKFYCV